MDGTTSEDVIYSGGNDTITTASGDEPPSLEDKVYGGDESNDLLVATDTSADVVD
jgi:hypothetical protein